MIYLKKLPFQHNATVRFTLALLIFAVALMSRFTLFPIDSGLVFVTFYPAIILSFYFCGAVPGSMVAVLSGLAGNYYFMKPHLAFSLAAFLSPTFVFYTLTASLIGYFIARLHTHIQQLDVILDNEMIGGMTIKNRRIVWCNKAMSKIIGYAPNALIGAPTKMLYADDTTYERVGREGYTALKEGKPYRTQFEMVRADGQKIWMDVSGGNISDDGQLTLWLMSDITKLKQLEEELKHQVNHDFLTGLHSRAYFMCQATIELNRALRYGNPMSLLMLDIDFFKRINDTHGHQAGDLVLKSLADLCRHTLRDCDICGRLGGEEFAVLLPETDKAKATEVAERLRLAIQQARVSLPTGGPPLQLSCSIGVTALSSNEDTMDILISQADGALYQAKNTGRNRVCVANVTNVG